MPAPSPSGSTGSAAGMGGRAAPAATGRLVAIELDPDSLGSGGTVIDGERAAAIRDLLEGNTFLPAGRAGAFRLRLAILDNKLVLDVAEAGGGPSVRHILSLAPLARVIKDYFLICDSYEAALRSAPAARIEAIDMGRRGVHNEGAETLRDRLRGKIDVDFETARRLFTLVCALRLKT